MRSDRSESSLRVDGFVSDYDLTITNLLEGVVEASDLIGVIAVSVTSRLATELRSVLALFCVYSKKYRSLEFLVNFREHYSIYYFSFLSSLNRSRSFIYRDNYSDLY